MRLAILGLGLIGGSLGLALRAAWPDSEIVGWDADPTAVATARARGAIAHAAEDAAIACAGADRVVLATPVMAMQDLLGAIAPHLAPGAIVTDVASTKAQVVEWAHAAGVPFVGGHPMAGTEKAGIAHADAALFDRATWCLTPTDAASQAAARRLEVMVEAVGARPWQLDPAAHDALVAAISHLPFAVSAALVARTTADPRWPQMARLASTGYRDATRLASGSPAMYRDICLTNHAAIAPLLRELAGDLLALSKTLEDPVALETFFTAARGARDAWLAERS